MSSATFQGDWLYCGGAALLDAAVTFDGEDVRTYLHDRLAKAGSFRVERNQLIISTSGEMEQRFTILRHSSFRFVLSDGDGDATYASNQGCCVSPCSDP